MVPTMHTDDPDVETDAEAAQEAVARVRERGQALADGEVEQALRKLEARGDLTDGQRAAVRAMAESIVASLVEVPARTVEAADDDAAVRAVVDLFAPEGAAEHED